MTNKPLISLFTPTNNPKFLNDVYDAIKLQNYPTWEWVIVLNGPAKGQKLNLDDERIKVFDSQCNSDNIGALKAEACDLCKGDALLEMDHDDLLTPDTLAKVAEGIAGGAGFVYSDVAVFLRHDESIETWGYSTAYGWENYPVEFYGIRYIATRMFDITPRSLCEVYFAPDHVRAWSREAYYNAGGHDPKLSVGDDHDLICRTYISGAKFHYTNHCGYLYRVHDSNTVKLRSQAIQTQTAVNRRNYLYPLITEWCRRSKLPLLDLEVEWTNGRWAPDKPGINGTNRYGHIIASHVMEMIPKEYQVGFMNSCYRALVPTGWLSVRVPDTTPYIADPRVIIETNAAGQMTGRIADPRIVTPLLADMNPNHKTRFNKNSFLYYTHKEFAVQMPGVQCRFDMAECSQITPPNEFFFPERKRSASELELVMLRADMCALKDDKRYPGFRLI